MITDTLNIQIVDSPSHAPKYTASTPLLKIETAIIVENGTVQGNPSVDLQLIDKDGNRYVVMATSGIIATLGEVVRAHMKEAL